MRSFLSSFFEVVEVAAIAVVSVFLIRTFLVQPFLVSGSSMSPNFSDGDYLLIDELTYRFRSPERGEVAVFRYPNDHSTYFIKRIIGLPGERVELSNGEVTIFNNDNPSGFVLDESYLPSGTVTKSQTTSVELKDGEYFVLGDNRSASFDSRSWGVLGDEDLVGLVRLRLWPVESIQAFAAPQYLN